VERGGNPQGGPGRTARPTDGAGANGPRDGVCTALADLPETALITPKALSEALGRSVSSVKRAVARGELPPPVRMAGACRWMVGGIVRHVEKRLAEAARRADRARRRIREDSP
jgi:predicted DNA-binding transcriptional regulator AlpA